MKLTRHHVECIYIFNNKDLSGTNLMGANLRDAYLRDANLRDANLRDANLVRANLRDANLRDANLIGTDIQHAYLRGADLRDANFFNCTGNGREIVTIQTSYYTINITKDIIAIGCEHHTLKEWLSFDDETIENMDKQALEFWNKYKDFIVTAHELNFGV